MKHLLILVVAVFFLAPVHAQDTQSTVEVQPVVIVTDVAPPETSVVCEAGATCPINETPPETPVVPVDNTVSYVVMAFSGLFLILGGLFSNRIIGLVGGLVSPEAAALMWREFQKTAIREGLTRSELTETQVDDEFFIAEAGKRGLEVFKDETGHYSIREKMIAPNVNDIMRIKGGNVTIGQSGVMRSDDPSIVWSQGSSAPANTGQFTSTPTGNIPADWFDSPDA